MTKNKNVLSSEAPLQTGWERTVLSEKTRSITLKVPLSLFDQLQAFALSEQRGFSNAVRLLLQRGLASSK